MKNVIMGVIGGLLVVYTIVLTLGLYSVNVRKNEVNNCVAAVLGTTMSRYYEQNDVTPYSEVVNNALVENEIKAQIMERLNSDSEVSIRVNACDINKGIISVNVQEKFVMPGGIEKTIDCKKTVIIDKSIREIE